MNYRPSSPTNPHEGLWWQIALGIFVGQLMIGALAAVAAFAFGFIAISGVKASLPKTSSRDLYVPRNAHQARSAPQLRPLADDERCIQGKRFRRLSNGWQELPSDPC